MCGVAGIKFLESTRDAKEITLAMLLRLQHRGQDSAGITILNDNNEFETDKGFGLIQNAISGWSRLSASPHAIAHTRYTTTGVGGVGEIQPFVRGIPKLALAFNGNITNTNELTEKFQLQVESVSDLDVLQQTYIHLKATQDFESTIRTIFKEFVGAYAVVGLNDNGTLFAFRDPCGIRPLFMAKNSHFVAFASETSSLDVLKALSDNVEISEVPPGGWVRVKDDKFEQGCIHSPQQINQQRKFCMFEMIYFSSPQSEYRSDSVYRWRFRLGEVLAQEIKAKHPQPREYFDYVVPVPETSRTAALAVAENLAVPYREFLVKNPYVPRTFIMNEQRQRLKALSTKLALIGPEVKGKKILLVDDSVVRGNTSRVMADQLREAGVRSVSLASTCPPIRYGCFYGIDFPDQKELVANGRDEEKIAEEIGIKKLFYISQKGMQEALGGSDLCMACLDGKYPTKSESFAHFLAQRREHRT